METQWLMQQSAGTLLVRALRLRCPVCGKGRMFRGFKSLDTCSYCGFHFEREVGYFTNALILNYTITALPIFFIIAPLAYFSGLSVWTLLGIGLAVAVLLPILGYRHSKTIWLAFDLSARPPKPIEFAPPGEHEAAWQPDR